MLNRLQTFYQMGKVLALNHHPEARADFLRDIHSGLINWNLFFWIGDSYRILPSVYLKLRDHRLLLEIPGEFVDHLQKVYVLNQERNQRILEQIADVNKLMNGIGIEPIYLKGSGNLIDGLYDDIGERFMFDIDLLVSDDEFIPAAEILENNGYKKQYGYSQETRFTIKHYPRLLKTGAPVGIEIHRQLTEFIHSKPFNTDLIRSEKKVPANFITGCYTLSNKHKIIHNVINSQVSDLGYLYGYGDMRQMYDLMLLAGREDPVKVVREFGYYRKQCRAGIKLISHVFGVPPKKSLSWVDNHSSWSFMIRHDMNHRSRRSRNTMKVLIDMHRQKDLFKAYARNLKKAMTDKPYRRERLRRLMNGTLFSQGI